MIRVIHKMRSGKDIPDHAYIGRPTILGNPFTHLTKDTKAIEIVETVEVAVDRYAGWFYEQLKTTPEFRDAAFNLVEQNRRKGELNLACWCKDELKPSPKDHMCHADVVREFVEFTYPAVVHYQRARRLMIDPDPEY